MIASTAFTVAFSPVTGALSLVDNDPS